MPKSSRLEFSEKFLGNNFALSEAEDNNSGLLNRGGIADLPLLRTLLAMDSLVLVEYASLVASRILLQRLLACLNFILDSEDLFFWY